MKIYLTLFLLAFASFSFSQSISGTEAVEYDSSQNRFIITNGGSILQQPSGSDDLEFFGDSDADYGMEIIGNTLITISGGFSQSVKFHDLTTEEELNSISIAGSSFLNGMASDPDGSRIWITDFGSERIYELDVTDIMNPVTETVVNSTGCIPNGITYDSDNNRLVFTCWSGGNINEVDLTDYSVSTLVDTDLGSIDGIDHDENGNFYISSWSPTRITKLSSEFTILETITASGLSQPADISYAVEIDSLAIANSGNNSITYIYFGTPDNVEGLQIDFDMSVFPNPINESSFIQFELNQAENCLVKIYNSEGKEVASLLNEKLSSGVHRLLLNGYTFSAGAYICELTTENSSKSIRLLVE